MWGTRAVGCVLARQGTHAPNGGVMGSNRNRSASTDQLPRAVYALLVGFVLWMAVAAWGFAGPEYADVALTVVTGFLLMAIAIPFVLWRMARANGADTDAPKLRAWASG